MQGMVRHIPHWRWTLASLIPSGTMSCCHPHLTKKNGGQCKPLQGLCAMPKWELPNMAPMLQHTKRWRRNPFHQQYGKWVLVLPCRHQVLWEWQQKWECYGMAYSTQHMVVRIWVNISRENVLALEYIMFQLQQREAFSSPCRLSTIGTLPIPWLHFCVPLNPNVHPTFRFPKIVHDNLITPTTNYKNNWERGDVWMDTMLLESLPFHI